MAFPVLIAARNEAHALPKTLERLPTSVEPIVIPNGCTDETAAVAEAYGAKVLEGSPEGKLPAIQHGMRYLGNRALEPFMLLDADSYPVFPERWLPRMLRARSELDQKKAALVVGPYYFNELDIVTAAWRNIGHWRHFYKTRNDPGHGAAGCNLLLDLRNRTNLHHVLALPNYWPREDAAIKDRLMQRGGQLKKVAHPHALVATSGDRFPGLKTRICLGREKSGELIRESYLREAPPGSMPYVELQYRSGQQKAG